MDIIKKSLANNKELYIIENKSMKSVIVWFMFYMPLNNSASENALISNILLRGSRNYPSSREMSKFLNASYGSIIGTDINLKGEVYTLGVYLNYISPKLDFIDGNIEKSMLQFLEDVIYHPIEENNAFNQEYFEIEKKNLLSQLQGKMNNKDSYAFDKTVEAMCEGEAYSIDKLGKINWIESLENEKCYERYKDIVNSSPLKVYVIGDVNVESFTKQLKEVFKFNDSKGMEVKVNHREINTTKKVIEEMDIGQGKLCIGFRTKIDVKSSEFGALSIVNRLFGGGPESKLFLNLREKESLCYSIYSTVEKHKGMIFVACGIDPLVKDIAIKKILDTLDSIKKGEFTREELLTCIAATKHSLISIKDNKYTYIGYLQGLNIYDADYTLEELCDGLNSVTKEDVVRVANTIKLDTVYFLGRGEKYEN